MNNSNTKLVKSKSSNNASSTKAKSSRSDNKSTSHAEIKPRVKKRGVYVEKKPTKTSVSEIGQNMSKRTKHIPRPGKKRFLSSVLTILSKSTTGTQFPDINDSNTNKNKMKSVRTLNNEISLLDDSKTIKKKPKYRSKVLNDGNNSDNEVVVLQSKKDISNTPSKCSERSSERIKWSDFLPPLVPKNDSDTTVIDTSKVKSASKQKRVTLVDNKEPVTLIGSESKKSYDEVKIGIESKKDDHLFNFFVDLLETTFDVYNVKTELNDKRTVECSKIFTDKDLPDAKKTITEDNKSINNFNKTEDNINNMCCYPHNYEIRNESKDYECVQNTQKSKIKGKRRLKSESFDYKKKNQIPLSHSFTNQSSVMPFRKISKKDHKRNFLHILKEELKMNDTIHEESQSFFQALKVMARNKRKFETSFNYNVSSKNNEDDDGECIFKTRKLLSYKSKSKKKKNHISCNQMTHPAHTDIPRSNKNITEVSDSESSLSIKVYGFDYETPNPNKYDDLENNDLVNGNYELNDEDFFNLSASSITLC